MTWCLILKSLFIANLDDIAQQGYTQLVLLLSIGWLPAGVICQNPDNFALQNAYPSSPKLSKNGIGNSEDVLEPAIVLPSMKASRPLPRRFFWLFSNFSSQASSFRSYPPDAHTCIIDVYIQSVRVVLTLTLKNKSKCCNIKARSSWPSHNWIHGDSTQGLGRSCGRVRYRKSREGLRQRFWDVSWSRIP
jgi:hypothetical protein